MGRHFKRGAAIRSEATDAAQLRIASYALFGLAVLFVAVAFVVPGASLWSPIVAVVLLAPAGSAYIFSYPPPAEVHEPAVDEHEATLVA
jgi:hypothetical protein